jgi:hypothetical protein
MSRRRVAICPSRKRRPHHFAEQAAARLRPLISWARLCRKFDADENFLSAQAFRLGRTIGIGLHERIAMIIGLTTLAVLTLIAIGEIRRTQHRQIKSED